MVQSIYQSDELNCSLYMKGKFSSLLNGGVVAFEATSFEKEAFLSIRCDYQSDQSWALLPYQSGIYSSLSAISRIKDRVKWGYPFSAYYRTLLIGDYNGGVILTALPDTNGFKTLFEIDPIQEGSIEIKIKMFNSKWILTRFAGTKNQGLRQLDKIVHKKIWPKSSSCQQISGEYLISLGFIDSSYTCNIPAAKGFSILEDLSQIIYKHLGEGQWINLFGYANGHNLLLPDYTPSRFLGGVEGLAKGVDLAHNYNQKVCLSLNISCADRVKVANDTDLQSAALKNELREDIYADQEHKLLLMNPYNPYWSHYIIAQVETLLKAHIDGLYLEFDYSHLALNVAEQRVVIKGLTSLINRIRDFGKPIFFKQSCDLYIADCSFLEPSLPWGESSVKAFLSHCPSSAFFSDTLEDIKAFYKEDIPLLYRVDFMGGEPYFYSEESLEDFENLLIGLKEKKRP